MKGPMLCTRCSEPADGIRGVGGTETEPLLCLVCHLGGVGNNPTANAKKKWIVVAEATRFIKVEVEACTEEEAKELAEDEFNAETMYGEEWKHAEIKEKKP